jgi:hypothetical protein
MNPPAAEPVCEIGVRLTLKGTFVVPLSVTGFGVTVHGIGAPVHVTVAWFVAPIQPETTRLNVAVPPALTVALLPPGFAVLIVSTGATGIGIVTELLVPPSFDTV